jgi:AcrR family transcriptional regulator
MDRLPTSERPARKGRAVRSGRPPRERAGEVDERILGAARRVFLEHGLAGASIDEIAALARAGKPTIYARYPGKEALFTAVVMRNVAAAVARFESHVPVGASVEERLVNLGDAILHWVLLSDTADLMRLGIAEARRFPDLASNVHRMARGRAEETVSRLLAEVAQSDEFSALPAFAPEQLATTTSFFNNLVVMPLMLRALFGEKPKSLEPEIGPHVARAVAFFLAACRQGGVH